MRRRLRKGDFEQTKSLTSTPRRTVAHSVPSQAGGCPKPSPKTSGLKVTESFLVLRSRLLFVQKISTSKRPDLSHEDWEARVKFFKSSETQCYRRKDSKILDIHLHCSMCKEGQVSCARWFDRGRGPGGRRPTSSSGRRVQSIRARTFFRTGSSYLTVPARGRSSVSSKTGQGQSVTWAGRRGWGRHGGGGGCCVTEALVPTKRKTKTFSARVCVCKNRVLGFHYGGVVPVCLLRPLSRYSGHFDRRRRGPAETSHVSSGGRLRETRLQGKF